MVIALNTRRDISAMAFTPASTSARFRERITIEYEGPSGTNDNSRVVTHARDPACFVRHLRVIRQKRGDHVVERLSLQNLNHRVGRLGTDGLPPGNSVEHQQESVGRRFVVQSLATYDPPVS